jgi:hypothetical protein
MALITIFWLGLTIAVAMLAKNRGRRTWLWFIFALALSPLLAFGLLMMKDDLTVKEFVETVSQSMEASHVRCPHCAEYVLPEATVCKYCHGRLAPQDSSLIQLKAQERIDEGLQDIKARELNIILSGAMAVGFALLVWLIYEFF